MGDGVRYRCDGWAGVAVGYDVQALAVQTAQQLDNVHERGVTRGEGAEEERALSAVDLDGGSKDEGRVCLLDGPNRRQGYLDAGAGHSGEKADAVGVEVPVT